MLLGHYDDFTRGNPYLGGQLGRWVGTKCSGAGLADFSGVLLWLALPASLLLATNWFFAGSLFGKKKLSLNFAGVPAVLSGATVRPKPEDSKHFHPAKVRKKESPRSARDGGTAPAVKTAPVLSVAPPVVAATGGTALVEAKPEQEPEPTIDEQGGLFGDEEVEKTLPWASENVSTEEDADTAWWKGSFWSEGEGKRNREEAARALEAYAEPGTEPLQDATALDEEEKFPDKSWWNTPGEAAEKSVVAEEDKRTEVREFKEEELTDPMKEGSVLEEEAADQTPTPAEEAGLAEEILLVEDVLVAEENVLADDDAAETMPQAELSFTDSENIEEQHVPNEEEEVFKKAVSLLVSEGKGTISMLQKELSLGYFKAAKLLNTLEKRGIINASSGNIAREVIISKEEAERLISED